MPYKVKFSKYGLKNEVINKKSKALRLAKNLRRLGYRAKVVKVK